MGKRGLYSKAKVVSHQFLDKGWKSETSMLRSKKAAQAHMFQSQHSNNDSLSNWGSVGCTENVTIPQAPKLRSVSRFPQAFFDHQLKELYHFQCDSLAPNSIDFALTSSPSGVFIEVTACARDSANITRNLRDAMRAIDPPPFLSVNNPSEAILWKVSCFAARESLCEKVQLFFAAPKSSGLKFIHGAPPDAANQWVATLQTTFTQCASNMFISGFHFVPLHTDGSLFKNLSLAGVHHRCLLRSVATQQNGVLHGKRALDALMQNGFLNYFPSEKFCSKMVSFFPFSRAYLAGDFKTCIAHYLKHAVLTNTFLKNVLFEFQESTAKVKVLIENPKILEKMLAQLFEQNIERTTPFFVLDGLLKRHKRGSRDPYQETLHSCLPSSLVDSKLRCVSEACFNAMTSLRIRMHGRNVVPGDLVVQRATSFSQFEYACSGGQVFPNVIDPDISLLPPSLISFNQSFTPVQVMSEEHARQFAITDVVLPVAYPLRTIAKNVLERTDFPSTGLWPANTLNRNVYRQFLESMGFTEGYLSQTRENIGYRHILAKPLVVDDVHEYCWDIYERSGGDVYRHSSSQGEPRITFTQKANHVGSPYSSSSSQPDNAMSRIYLNNLSDISWMEVQKNQSLSALVGKQFAESIFAIQMTLPPDAFVQSALHGIIDFEGEIP